MKFRYKGRPKALQVIFSEGDVVEVGHKRAEAMLRGHPNFEEVKPRAKRNGGNKSGNSEQSA